MSTATLFSVVVIDAEREIDCIGPFISVTDAIEAIGSYPPAIAILCADAERDVRPIHSSLEHAELIGRFEDHAFTYHLIYERIFPRPVGFRFWSGIT